MSLHVGIGKGLAHFARTSSSFQPGALVDYDLKRGLSLGPSLSVSRASQGYAQDSGGNWLPFAANVARRTDLGLWSEPAGTNGIRNPRMVGAVAGSPGTLPTNWANFLGGSISQQIVGTGTENGIDYIDVRWFGTTSVANGSAVFFDTATAIAGLTGQIWVQSAFARMIAGSTANITNLRITLQEYASDGVTVQRTNAAPSFAASASAANLGAARRSQSVVLSGASTASIRAYLEITYNSGAVIDITMRIGWPQLEQSTAGAPSSPILPAAGTTGVSTRAAEAITVQGTGMARFVYTFDDGSTQTVAQNPATQHVIPTNLNRRIITRMTGYAS